jgi:hypothetical protein
MTAKPPEHMSFLLEINDLRSFFGNLPGVLVISGPSLAE